MTTDPAAPMDADRLIVLVPHEPRPRRSRSLLAKPGPTTTLTVAVPRALADELKHTVSVLPGVSLDALVIAALERVLAEHAAPPARPARRAGAPSIADDCIVVITE